MIRHDAIPAYSFDLLLLRFQRDALCTYIVNQVALPPHNLFYFE